MYKNEKKKVRLVDIAFEAGVSPVTVGKVLNSTGGKNARVSEKTAVQIREIAMRMNYRPDLIAQQLAGKKSRIIGVVMDSCAPQILHNNLSKMEMYASSKGYKFMIGQTHEDIQKIKDYAYEFSSYGVDGIICMAHFYPGASKEIAELYSSVTKTVFLGAPLGVDDAYSVTVNMQGAYKRAVEYLVKNGKDKIALLLMQGFFADESMVIREKGYMEGVKSCNLAYNANLIQKIPTESLMEESCYLPVIKKLIFEHKANAIIAGNDHMAAMIIKTLLKLELKVPDDVSVIGYDNIDVARLISPTLTTFDQNGEKVSKAVVDLLINLIKGEKVSTEDKRIIIEPPLIERESA
jgi:LacI family transcriptional regulator